MSQDALLSIDQGTTNTKAVLIDAGTGHVLAKASIPMEVSYPQPGWAEQSADSIWQSVRSVIASVLKGQDVRVLSLAISNQRESIVLWDRATGEAIAPVVIWQCRRSAPLCDALRAAGHNAEIVARTGLAIDPLFPAAKIAWILDSVPAARDRAARGELQAGTVDAFLLHRLTAGAVHATDYSNASRTQLFNTSTLSWDETLGELFGVPLDILPRPLPSDSLFGTTADGATALPAGTQIHAMMGDSHAALFGHGVRQPGIVKATYGTGTSLMTLTSTRIASRHGLSGTIAWGTSAGVAYAIEGNISVSGQAAAFMADLLGIASVDALATLAGTVQDSNGISFVPALVGLGAPHWNAAARGLIDGLSLGTRPAHLALAAIEAIALQIVDVFTAMEADIGTPLDQLLADGGASRNGMLMQLQSDLLGRPVLRRNVAELSALGAATMAAHGLNIDLSSWIAAKTETFNSSRDLHWRNESMARWHRSVLRTLN